MRRLLHWLLMLIAIVFLIEAWLWSHLEPIVAWIVRQIPLRRLKRRLVLLVDWLSPPAALVVFIVPGLILFPIKVAAVWLLAHKHWLLASLAFAFAKLVGLGVAAYVFELTKPKLLRMAWFRLVYEKMLVWLAWAHALVNPITRRLRKLYRVMMPRNGGRALKLLWRIRHRMQATRRAPDAAFRAGEPRAARTAQSP